jgi:hypothetical protein
MKDQPTNHVVFLGAGASRTPGYPVGDSLRLRLSCPTHLEEALKQGPALPTSDIAYESARHFLLDPFGGLLALFREGGFATVDEFSKLA